MKAAISFLISLGAFIGLVDTFQMLVYSIFFVILYSLN